MIIDDQRSGGRIGGQIVPAIRDCSRRGEIVLDAFGGSGAPLIAAETCGRSGRLIEFDPLYCDVIVRRYERLAGKAARLLATNETFDAVAVTRGIAA